MPHSNSHSICLGDVQASRIAIDPTGQFCALSGALEVILFPLDRPTSKLRFPLNLKYDPVGILWHPNDPAQLGLVCFNRCELLLWDTALDRLSVQHSLGGYVRPITSFDWSPADSNLLVTSSSDQFRAICIWDLRDLSRPVRAIESLSDPKIVKWNRLSAHIFASLHRSDTRLWDLRTNHPETLPLEKISPESNRSGSSGVIKNFDWSPKVESELVTVDQDGLLCLWNTKRLLGPYQQHRCGVSHITRLLYSPSGDQILTLPDSANWACHGLGVWSSSNLQKLPPNLWNSDASWDTSRFPAPSDPMVVDLAWRIKPTSGFHRTYDEAHFNYDDNNQSEAGNDSGSLVELITLSVDHALRCYTICSSPNRAISELAAATATAEASTPESDVHAVALPTSPNPLSDSGSPSTGRDSRLIASHHVQNIPPDSIRSKHSNGHSKMEDNSQRSFPMTTTPIPLGGKGGGPSEDSAYKLLAQELSLLSPHAGQYKIEEIDLINRNAKLTLFYCRRKHYHNYAVCSAYAGIRDRNLTADTEDLDSLLLTHTDMPSSLDSSMRSEHLGRFSEPNKCSGDSDAVSGDERQRRVSCSAAFSASQQHHRPWGTPDSFSILRVPAAGTVTVSVSFPMAYPSTAPTFSVLAHHPTLPDELITKLSDVLHTTANELAHSSRGSMDPCVRKAVDFLQSASSTRLPVLPGDATVLGNSLLMGPNEAERHSGQSNFLLIDPDDLHRIRVPFPRTSGARYSAQGFLVTFGLRDDVCSTRSHNSGVYMSSFPNPDGWTPRTLQDFCCIVQRQAQADKTTSAPHAGLRGPSDVASSTTLRGEAYLPAVEKESLGQRPLALVGSSDTRGHDTTTAQSTVGSHLKYLRGLEMKPADSLQLASGLFTDDNSCDTPLPEAVDQLSTMRRSIVQIYDLSSWFVHKKLIQSYSLNTEEVRQMCAHNYSVALQTGRVDIIRFWRYAVVLASSITPLFAYSSTVPPLPFHPVGKVMFHQWLSYFIHLRDVQHLAMAVLVLSGLDSLYNPVVPASPSQRKTIVPYVASKPSLTESTYGSEESPSRWTLKGVNSIGQLSVTEQESFCADVNRRTTTVAFNVGASDEGDLASVRDAMVPTSSPVPSGCCDPDYTDRMRFVTQEDLPAFAHYIASYANMLYSMRRFLRHARLLRAWAWCLQQHGAFRPDINLCPSGAQLCFSSPLFSLTRNDGGSELAPSYCLPPDSLAATNDPPLPNFGILCSICRMKTKGLVFLCPKCLHGGHVDHMLQWFGTMMPAQQGARECPIPDCYCYCCLSADFNCK